MLWLNNLKIGYDICENCDKKGGHDEHGKIMILYCYFPIYDKYNWIYNKYD